MARRRSRLRLYAEYGALRAVVGVLGLLPHAWALACGRAIGRLGHALVASRRRIAAENLLAVYGDKLSEAEQRRIGRQSFESLGLLLADFARMPRLSAAGAAELVSYEGAENYLKAVAAGRGILYLTAHFGSWELMPYVQGLMGRPLAFIVRPADNPLIEAWLKRVREASGCRVIVKRQAFKEVFKALAAGGAVGVLIDQAVAPSLGVAGTFLGRPAHTTAAVAHIALRTRAAVLPVFLVREADGLRHRLVVEPEVELVVSGDRDRDVAVNTERFVRVVEAFVERWPEQWLWCHRRWREPAAAEAPAEDMAASEL